MKNQFRIEESGSQVTIWYDDGWVGIRFVKNESLQRYLSEFVFTNTRLLAMMNEDPERLEDILKALTQYASENYPKEFAEIH